VRSNYTTNMRITHTLLTVLLLAPLVACVSRHDKPSAAPAKAQRALLNRRRTVALKSAGTLRDGPCYPSTEFRRISWAADHGGRRWRMVRNLTPFTRPDWSS